jgi:hypothetical protein
MAVVPMVSRSNPDALPYESIGTGVWFRETSRRLLGRLWAKIGSPFCAFPLRPLSTIRMSRKFDRGALRTFTPPGQPQDRVFGEVFSCIITRQCITAFRADSSAGMFDCGVSLDQWSKPSHAKIRCGQHEAMLPCVVTGDFQLASIRSRGISIVYGSRGYVFGGDFLMTIRLAGALLVGLLVASCEMHAPERHDVIPSVGGRGLYTCALTSPSPSRQVIADSPQDAERLCLQPSNR